MKKVLIKITFCLLGAVFFYLPLPTGAATMGEETPFFVDNSYDAFGRMALVSTLQEVSERAYFYTEDEWWDGLTSPNLAKAAIRELAVEFDEKIYPALTQSFGPLWEPGIDNDPKITILISRIQEGAGGYFNSADEYPKEQAPHSNEREMIYLNTAYYDTPRAKSFLAHEFQHLITFYQKEKLHNVSDDVWLNEARSEYASTLCGYDDVFAGSNLEKRIMDFLKNPSDSLTEWVNMSNDYGTANLFMRYLVSHFGNQILTKIVQSDKVGIASIDEALKNSGFSENFSAVFLNWSIANYLNDCRVGGQRYCYLSTVLGEKIKVPPTVYQIFPDAGEYSIKRTDLTKDWSGHWYKFSGGNNNLKINFEGTADSNFLVAYIIQKADGTNEVKFIKLDEAKKGIGFVEGLGKQISSVVLVPVSRVKTAGFSGPEISHSFSYEAVLTSEILNPEIINPSPPPASLISNYPDGSLIRANGDDKVYIIKGGFKRWIQSGEIFKFYPHLKWESIIEVTKSELDFYKDAWLVRADGDPRVYEINGDGTKHWLNMTAAQFSLTGRDWNMVFVINKAERDFYKTGAAVIFK